MKRIIDSLDDLGRFSEPALLIMISLADGPKHGYAMTLDIEQVSGQKLGPGTLYGAIARLEEREWIKGTWVEKAGERRRRFYKLTAEGRRVLAEQRKTWDAFVEAVRRVTGGDFGNRVPIA